MLIKQLLKVKRRDVSWLKDALRTAIQLEFFTIPPYLCALWSIVDGSREVSSRIRGIVQEEMLHMGLACNMLVALDPPNSRDAAFPPLADPRFVPRYPSPLPGIGDGSLIVGLAPVSKDVVEHIFMRIEYPQRGPVRSFRNLSKTIGEFYQAIRGELKNVPRFFPDRQLQDGSTWSLGLARLTSLADAEDAIDTIVGQGEGKPGTPCAGKPASKCALAHYYKFKEIRDEVAYEWDDAAKKLVTTSKKVPFPQSDKIYDMAVIPCGGYPYDAKVPELKLFDAKYTDLLDMLQGAWQQGNQGLLDAAVDIMRDSSAGSLSDLARTLMSRPLASGRSGNYGPNFRLI